MKKWKIRSLGGPGSGNFGHAGREGKVGGSAPSLGGAIPSLRDVSPERAESIMSNIAPEISMFDIGDTARSAWLAPSGTLYKVKWEHEDVEKDIARELDVSSINLSKMGFSRITSSTSRQGLKIYVDMDRDSTGNKALRVIKDIAQFTPPDTITYAIYSKGTIAFEGNYDNEGLLRKIEQVFGLSEDN